MQPTFIHLRLHSEYSLSDSLIRVEDLTETAAKLGMPAIAVTDQSNLFATVKFYKAAIKDGIKPIIGVDCYIDNPANPSQPFLLTLLCQNKNGYLNLTELISRAYIEGQTPTSELPLLQKAWLNGKCDGLIALSGGREGEVGQTLLANKRALAEEALQSWLELFPERFYLELQRTGRAHEEDYLHYAVELAQAFNVPVVATNDVRFLVPEDFEAHEARVCIHSGHVLIDPKRPKNYSTQQYLRSAEDMQKLFADIPSALANTVEIAKRCNLEMSFGKSYLPQFPIPSGLTTEEYLIKIAEEGLEKRLEILFDKNAADFAEKRKEYFERLRIELNVINSMGFAGYFLIVADFIQWSKENGIPVGPGRGSGAGSLVAYAILITDIDPLQYQLLFERFLNPERVSMPDFDVDFCMDGRDRVIEYVANKYGRDAVSQIITYGSMAAKAVVRDVGRVLGHPYGMVDKIAKLIPFELGITLEKALAQEEELKRRYENEEEVKVLFDLALKLEGLARNAGKHAGGVVIAPTKLTDFSPLYCEPGGENRVTQFDKDDIESVGLVKFDFLGLRTLTIINWTVQTINFKRAQNSEEPLDITLIPLDDEKTFKLLKDCQTTAVFQLESRGMKDLVKRLQPSCFEDIIDLGALFRPGPLQSGMVDDYINRKHGRAAVEYAHPMLEPILRPTHGMIVYQEQVMQIAQVLAKYTLGGADLLRRAMGKKKPEEMEEQRGIFLAGSKENGVDTDTANSIFDLMEKFSGYGFNKSHSAAYALVSYQTAWLKAHYPAEFMAAVLSSDMDNTDKVVFFLDECRNLKLTVLPPNINYSQHKFTVNDQKQIVYGLGAVKGAGEAAILNLIACREEEGSYKDIFDFCRRIDTKKANRRVLEALIKSGSMDDLSPNRASLMLALDAALQAAEQHLQTLQLGQHDLFGEATAEIVAPVEMPNVPDWPKAERLQNEKEVLGFYLSGHPLQRYEYELKHIIKAPLAHMNSIRSQTVIVAGWVVGLRVLFTKRGDRMAIITLEDQTGRLELTAFSEAFNAYKDLVNKDSLLIVEGEVSFDEFTGNNRVMARRMFDITTAREQFAKGLLFKVAAENATDSFVQRLQQIMSPFRPGRCPIMVEYHRPDSVVKLALGDQWQVRPTDQLLDSLHEVLGNQAVSMLYAVEE